MADNGIRVTPNGLNAAIASLFVAGSACFAVGSFPGYLDAVGGKGEKPHDDQEAAARSPCEPFT